jgi:pyrroloquinoline quinone biosynthesis protein B
VVPRLQSSIAVRSARGPWFLVNASPDVQKQVDTLRGTAGNGRRGELRWSPVAGVLLTDAEIDHALGLAVLRESPVPLTLFSTRTVQKALREGFPLLNALDGYCGVDWRELIPGREVLLGPESAGPLVAMPFALPGDPPLYMKGRGADWDGFQIGFTFHDPDTGGVVTYAPGLAELTDAVVERLADSDAVLVDGTFARNDEMTALGLSGRSAIDMGHLPLLGEGGSLERLSSLPSGRKILVHVNNTNPILHEGSIERSAVERAGVEVAWDGLTLEL